MSFRNVIIIAIYCASVIEFGNCSRILAVCPRASKSLQIIFRGLTLALNERGHELVVVTTDPVNNSSLKNYREIDISFIYDSNSNTVPDTTPWLQVFPNFVRMLDIQIHQILGYPELEKLYAPDSDEHFDVILLELLYWPAFYPLARRFDAPIIGFSPMALPINIQYTLGNPVMTSHLANWELYTSSEPLSFYQRVKNWISFWKFVYFYRTVYTPSQEVIARKYFGNDIPDLNEMEKNISLIFVNQQTAITHVKPNVPKVIAINGFHITKKIKPLPENLQKILDEATEGFVYMSLGTNMKSNMLSEKKRSEFIAAFSRLPYKVLWKFEDDVLPDKPDNVHIMKWVPQQEVLAHPNLKVFVYQGGLHSTEEAVTHAAPLVGIPTWADQQMQVDRMVTLGVGKKLVMSTLNGDDLEKAILTVALDKSYKENMLHLRDVLNEKSHDLLDSAIWWLEHVVRHKGAPYLHSSTADEPWYQRQDMDVIAFLSAGATTFSVLAIFTFHKFLSGGMRAYTSLLPSKIKKII